MLSELIQLGLTNGEARVYVSLLKSGPSKVGSVVKDSRVSYSKVYDVLERLMTKGLVSYVIAGNIKHFNAVEPYRLQEYVRKKQEQLKIQKDIAEKIIPDLVDIIDKRRKIKTTKSKSKEEQEEESIGRNQAEIFKGDKGLRTAYEILLTDSNKGEILRYFYPYDDYHDIASPFYSRFYLFQKSKGLIERGISTINFRKSRHFREEVPKDVNMRFVNFPLPSTMDIFQNKILMISWSTITGILIHSEEMTDHFTNYFDSLWELAAK